MAGRHHRPCGRVGHGGGGAASLHYHIAELSSRWFYGLFFAWFVEELRIFFSPRLAIQAPFKRCGKTTSLDALSCLVARPDMNSSITPSALFRTIDEEHRTILIDEANLFAYQGGSPEMRMIMNAGHRRSTAVVKRTEQLPNGSRVRRTFDVFATIALATH